MARARRVTKCHTIEDEEPVKVGVNTPEEQTRTVSQRQKRKSDISTSETNDISKKSTAKKRRKSAVETKVDGGKDGAIEEGKESAVINGDAETRGTKYWLMKAEPETRIVKGKDVKFSIDDLEAMKTSPWDGVRNHQAKNFMKSMKLGDKAFLYHSNCKVPGITGIMEICQEAYPDHTATDPSHPYYDEKSTKKDEPTWYMVDVSFVRRLKRIIPLKELQEYKEKELKDMVVVGKTRLSVQPVRENEWKFILTLEDKEQED